MVGFDLKIYDRKIYKTRSEQLVLEQSRHIDPWIRTDCSEMNPHAYGQLSINSAKNTRQKEDRWVLQ